MKSSREVLSLEKIVFPFTIVFPVDIEGSINNDSYRFKKGVLSTLTFEQYEALRHSSYEEYLN